MVDPPDGRIGSGYESGPAIGEPGQAWAKLHLESCREAFGRTLIVGLHGWKPLEIQSQLVEWADGVIEENRKLLLTAESLF